ncbi:hydantoinase/oxoprolinase family protein [Martelella alba]|uniref:hydantoinase/oxoprolinase family protein n=1 Tax=Martelella alba TaxID=2590451 RepID=UPI001E3C795D|nr:hydantoinase/oxoprolinase family protein [Martelella alba]
MQAHLRDLERDLRAEGFQGELMMSTIMGGLMGIGALNERPIYTVGSGPAMAPIAAAAFSLAEQLGGNVIVCDTGGTTFDVGLVRDGQLTYSRDTWIGEQWRGHLLGISSVDIRSIGAGGGSIAWIDDGGLLRVGPQSAGSEPGPACYGRGGCLPTVSDAACVLGYFNADAFLGGRMRLDVAAARKSIATLAEQLGRGIEQTAYDIVAIASELMIKAIHEITTTEGLNPRESAIVAGGGAAGLNIMPIAQELGCERVLLPCAASALSASGMQFADVVREETASHYTLSTAFDAAGITAVLDDHVLRHQAFMTEPAMAGHAASHIGHVVEARYAGQVWLIDVAVPEGDLATAAGQSALFDAFHHAHERIFAISDPHSAIEFLTWKTRLTVEVPSPPHARRAAAQGQTRPHTHRRCFFAEGVEAATPVYLASDLAAGHTIPGPAVIEEPTTTLVVYPGMRVTLSGYGNYLLDTRTEA